jgi:hypothetical protein
MSTFLYRMRTGLGADWGKPSAIRSAGTPHPAKRDLGIFPADCRAGTGQASHTRGFGEGNHCDAVNFRALSDPPPGQVAKLGNINKR